MIHNFFKFNSSFKQYILSKYQDFPIDSIQWAVFNREYAKPIYDRHEYWPECVLRVIEGNYSIRKDFYIKSSLEWDDAYWNNIAEYAVISMLNLEWLPAGRHLKMSGTKYVETHGSASLNNCSAVTSQDLAWGARRLMDFSLAGCGCGFDTVWDGKLYSTIGKIKKYNKPPISDAIEDLINAYVKNSYYPEYVNLSNKKKKLLNDISSICENNSESFRVVADIYNIIGKYASTEGRSAQIILGQPTTDFMSLKNYDLYPERIDYGYISNNSVVLQNQEDFLMIPDIVENIIACGGDPGIINLINIQKYGKYGIEKEDNATLMNPCGEVPLEPNELCNLVTTFPEKGFKKWKKALKFATIHALNASLLPSEFPETNQIIAKNRRIGVSMTGLARIFDKIPMSIFIREMRDGYKYIQMLSDSLSKHAGVRTPIRTTCIKPEGSMSILGNTTSGVHFPVFSGRGIRRIRLNKKSRISKQLIENTELYYEQDIYEKSNYVFEFPIYETTRSVDTVSLAEQFSIVALMQREWSDNAVSATCYFDEDDLNDVERLIALHIPVLKSISLLKHDFTYYEQMPFEKNKK